VSIVFLDKILGTNLISQNKFWIFQAVVALLTTIVDNYSSGRPIIIFSDTVISGIRIINVPIENYLFGFSLLALNLILFEYFSRKKYEITSCYYRCWIRWTGSIGISG